MNLKNPVEDFELVVELKNYYTTILEPSGLELRSEVKSRKLLVELITLCVIHRQCQLEFPDVASKRLEFSEDSLCIAVFRNKQQEDAALSVIEYFKNVNAFFKIYGLSIKMNYKKEKNLNFFKLPDETWEKENNIK